MYKGYLTDIDGIRVGHAVDKEGITGCTMIICDEGAIAGIDSRGGYVGTKDTDDFNPKMATEKIPGIMLTGGGSFGLASSSGAMDRLSEEEVRVGFTVEEGDIEIIVPLVPSASIFDLNIGDYKMRPDYKMGYDATKTATFNENRQGNVGCGIGATIGKILGIENAMKGGLGSATVEAGNLKVSALVVVNAVGDVYDYKTGEIIVGSYDYEKNELKGGLSGFIKNEGANRSFNGSIGVIATNAKLTQAVANKIAAMGQNGLARTIKPMNTFLDGDTLFTMATGKVEADISLVGTLAAEAVSRAVMNGIKAAVKLDKVKSYRDIKEL